jgi:hypothetical protein
MWDGRGLITTTTTITAAAATTATATAAAYSIQNSSFMNQQGTNSFPAFDQVLI